MSDKEAPVVLALTLPNERVMCLAATHCEVITCFKVGDNGLETTVELMITGIIGRPEIPGHATHAALYLNDIIDGTLICQFLDCDFFWDVGSKGRTVIKGTASSVHQIIGAGVEFED